MPETIRLHLLDLIFPPSSRRGSIDRVSRSASRQNWKVEGTFHARKCKWHRRAICAFAKVKMRTGARARPPSLVIIGLTAGGRNDIIHPQIFHHLTIVVKAVSYDSTGHTQARDRGVSKWTLDLLHHICRIHCQGCFVHGGK
jgi:hypothetical protein